MLFTFRHGVRDLRGHVRARVGPGARVFGLPWWAANYLVSVIHFAMQRKQLIDIARRAACAR